TRFSRDWSSDVCSSDLHALEARALRLDVIADLLQELLGVLDRIALGELVRLAQDLAGLVDQDGLRRGRAAIEPDHPAHDAARLEPRRREFRDRVGVHETPRLGVARRERRARLLAEPRAPSVG